MTSFPENFEEMVMYGDYRRGDGGELAYALPETINAAKDGRRLPSGTALVLELYDNDQVASYFVMQKGDGWGRGYPEDVRTGDWNFQQFTTRREVGERNPEGCMACHGDQADEDFLFTADRMESYMP